MQNAYFKITSDGSKFGLLLEPPQNGGEPLNVAEVMDYLKEQGMVFSFEMISDAIESGERKILPLGTGNCPRINMEYEVRVTEDAMQAYVRLYSPSDTGAALTAGEIIRGLAQKQIKVGILEEAIKEAIEKEIYCTDILAAQGSPIREGKDAYITYLFNTDPKVRPTLNEDGSVDFFHLNTLNPCKKGDVLARLTKEDPGELGMTVYGASVKPKPVRRASLRSGKNLTVSEDGTELISEVDGHVSFLDGRVFVSDVLELKNVDTSTGNIDFEGSVTIEGNVQSNFSVNAGGNILVRGLVEGATLKSGGDIILIRGMAGAGKGSLTAGGNIVAKFLEYTTASAGGYVRSESILHSTVTAKEEITVDGRKGFISGGTIAATNLVEAKTLGSHLGTNTVIEVGVIPDRKDRLNKVRKSIGELIKKIHDIDPVIVTYSQKYKQGVSISMDQMKYLKNLIQAREQCAKELKVFTAEAEEIESMISRQADAQVIVHGEVYPGVRIVIGDVSMSVPSNMQYCRFIKLRGDVKMVGI